MAEKKAASTCKLCWEERDLCDSHIIPEFVYAPVYLDGENWTLGFRRTRYSEGWEARKVQKGLREPLLCGECEQLLNREYEQPSVAFWRALTREDEMPRGVTFEILNTRMGNRGVAFDGVDYRSFKLFLLSILWRCSVSSIPTYREVDLGPYEEELRLMVFEGDPGGQGDFPCIIHLLEDPGLGLISLAVPGRFEGHRSYSLQLSSVSLLFLVSGHLPERFERYSLHPSGHLTTPIKKVEDLPLIQRAERVAREASVPPGWISEDEG